MLRLSEMYLGRSRTLWRKTYPLVHGFTGSAGREEHNVAGPGQLQDVGGGNLDRAVVLNRRLAGPTPFTGEDVTVVVGLWSVPGEDVAKALVSTIGSVSELVGAAGTPVTQVIGLVKSSVETILGLDGTALRLGVGDTFFAGNPLRAGFHVGIGAAADAVDTRSLWIRDGRLVIGRDRRVARPYDLHDYFVVQVEGLDTRPDWPGLPGLREFDDTFASAFRAGGGAEAIRGRLRDLWPGFVETVRQSEDLTKTHADKVKADVAADLERRLHAIEYGNPFETRAWEDAAETVRLPEDFDLADVPDSVPMGAELSPPTFLEQGPR